jgi:hypothetical protein
MSFEKPKVGGPIEEVSGEEEPVGIGIEAEEELERESEVLKSMVGGIAERLKREHVPVTEDCRIDMTMFRGVYSPEAIQRD